MLAWITACPIPKSVKFAGGLKYMYYELLAFIRKVAVPFKEKLRIFSPQKSSVSELRVYICEAVSLKVYLYKLFMVWPAKVSKFST